MTMPKVLDGLSLKSKILTELTDRISRLEEKFNSKPGLAVILVGNNPASKAYVGMKKKACVQIGIKSFEYKLEIKKKNF